MNKLRTLFILSVVSVVHASCFKEDEKIVLPPAGQAVVASVALGSDYKNQVFFSLRNGTVLTNEYAAWDLAFESSPTGYHVWLNGGKGVRAATFGTSNFSGITSVTGAVWKWDEASWNPDSTAIGDWRNIASRVQTTANSTTRTDDDNVVTSHVVYLVDRGSMYTGSDRYWKMTLRAYDAGSYTFKYAKLDNSFVDSIVLQKTPQEAYTYFTFDNAGAPITMEPDVNSWDFVFTRYRHIFYYTTPPTPYSVNGALLNPNGIKALQDSITPYEQIDLAFAEQATLSAQRNVIGYNWKYYDFTAQRYVVKPHFSYILRDRQGYFWKLRFLDFYNDQGEKGYPKFEYQRL